MRRDKQATGSFRRRLFTSSMVVVLVAGTLGLAANAAAAAPTQQGRPNPLSSALQKVAKPDTAATSALAGAGITPLTSGPGSLASNAPGQLTVEVRLKAITPQQVAAVKGAGAVVTFTDNPTRTLTADIAIANLERLAAVPGVEYVNEVHRPMTSSTCEQGNKVSEGDVQLSAATARTTKGVTGNGVKVGVLSDSFAVAAGPVTTFAQDVANGDLPGATNTCAFQQTPMGVTDFASGTDEGRGMAQIVHDIAPQAQIDFATANNTQAIFANNIRNLQIAGAKVIVDDITYFAEPMYQDGVIAKAVQDVTDLGTVYYSSAGNNNFNVGGVPVSSYEAQNGYRPMACPASVSAGHTDCHDFDPSAGTSDGDTVTWNANTTLRMVMGWNEPAFGVTTDFDYYILDGAGAIVLSSTNNNLVSQTPFEFFAGTTGASPFTGKLVVARKTGVAPASTPRFKLVFFGNGAQGFTAVQWSSLNSTDTFGPATYGHNAKINAATVAAVPFNNSTIAEGFTSKGPATYCFGPIVGAVAAAPLPGGCTTKQIDMAATDGGANTFFGQNAGGGIFRFYGTSAAAPHAAAVAALMLEKSPCATPAQIIAAQKSTAAAVGTQPVNVVGSGLINANSAVAAMPACAPVVSSLGPNTGPTTGGLVLIRGTSFTGATAVSFGGTPALAFFVAAPKQILAVVPPRAAGAVNVTVTTPAGTSPAAPGNVYTYSATRPGSVSGTVTAAVGGAPIPDVLPVVMPAGAPTFVSFGRTAANGTFTVHNLSPGSYKIAFFDLADLQGNPSHFLAEYYNNGGTPSLPEASPVSAAFASATTINITSDTVTPLSPIQLAHTP